VTAPLRLPSPETVAEIRALAERRLSPEEFAACANAPISDDERREALSLIEWFTRRYPTPTERLAYARKAYARWARAMPPGARK
jgi:hypothetical protein